MDLGPVRRQSLLGFGSSVGITVIGFFATVYIAHAAGPAALGGYYLFLAYLGIAGLFTDAGLGGAAVQRISGAEEREEYFSAHALFRILLLSAVLVALVAARPLLVDLDNSGLFIWLLAGLVITTLAGIVSTGVYAAGKAGVIQVSDLLNNIFRVIIQVIAVYVGYAAGGLAFGFIAGAVTGILVNYRAFGIKPARFCARHVKSLLAFSGWVFLTALTGALMGYADTILVGYYLSNTEVGMYRTAYQLATVALFSMLALRTALYPKIVQWIREGRKDQAEAALSRAITYSLALAIPAAAGAWVLGGQLLYYLYGDSFVAAGPAMALLFAMEIVTVFLSLETMCISALDMPREVFVVTGIGAACTIILDVLLIPRYGITGAAVALLCGTLLFAVIAHIVVKKSFKVGLERKPVGAILAASGVMAAVVLLYQYAIPVTSVYLIAGAVLIGMLVYVLLLVRLDQGLHDEIRELVRGIGIPWP